MKNLNKKTGFTLIELLVVISIIGLLSSIVLASLTNARKKAQLSTMAQELHQLQNAMEMYKLSNNGKPILVSNGVIEGSLNLQAYLQKLVDDKFIPTISKTPFPNQQHGIDFGYASRETWNDSPSYRCGEKTDGSYMFYIYDQQAWFTGIAEYDLDNTLPSRYYYDFENPDNGWQKIPGQWCLSD